MTAVMRAGDSVTSATRDAPETAGHGAGGVRCPGAVPAVDSYSAAVSAGNSTSVDLGLTQIRGTVVFGGEVGRTPSADRARFEVTKYGVHAGFALTAPEPAVGTLSTFGASWRATFADAALESAAEKGATLTDGRSTISFNNKTGLATVIAAEPLYVPRLGGALPSRVDVDTQRIAFPFNAKGLPTVGPITWSVKRDSPHFFGLWRSTTELSSLEATLAAR